MWKVQSSLQHLLGQQHQNQRPEENQQTDQESWICAGCNFRDAGDDCTKENAAQADEDDGGLFTPSPQHTHQTTECVQ